MAQAMKRVLTGSAAGCALALAGCGGGSTGGSRPSPTPPPVTVTPTPSPTPTPAPTPTPTAINYNDAEYRNSNGATTSNALAAYDAGATGGDVTIAIVDSGINPDLPEFAGRIHGASRDITSNRGVTDTEGHGTAVSATAAAGRDGSRMLGVAFDATILSLNTSDPTDCDGEDGCSHYDNDIAEAIDIARSNGARVINISLGGEGAGSTLLAAVNRATADGIVIVMSAGNEGEANPGGFALESARSGNGALIIAGAHDARRDIASFSNQAGTGAQHYLTALGTSVRTIDHQTGGLAIYQGTSFSAPIISGAAALLASAFPNLSGQQIVELLLASADDAGAPGRDSTFGNGILNIARAFEPRGATTLAGSGAPVSLGSNGTTAGPMGDAQGPQSLGAIILDGYSRAYAVDLARSLSTAPQERPLASALGGDTSSATAAGGTTAVSITMRRNFSGNPEVGLAQAGLSYQDGRKAKAVAGLAISRLTPRTAVALGFSESGKTLQQRLAGAEHKAFLVARDPTARTGFVADGQSAIGIRHDLGPAALTVTSERGEIRDYGPRRAFDSGYSIGSVTADRRIGPARLSLGATRLEEDATILGGRFSGVFGNGGATSWFVDGAASFDLGKGWGASASYRRGWTILPAGGLAEGGSLASEAFSVDLSKRGAFTAGDRLAFRMMQPLRVRSGGFDLSVPTSYDYATGGVGYEARQYSLAPSGRELDFEAAYGLSLFDGDLSANLFLRTDPGHVEAMRSDLGGAVRFSLGF